MVIPFCSAPCRLGASPECVCVAGEARRDQEDDAFGSQGHRTAGRRSGAGGHWETDGKSWVRAAHVWKRSELHLPIGCLWSCSCPPEMRSLCRQSSWAGWDPTPARRLCASTGTLTSSQPILTTAGIQNLSLWWRKMVRDEDRFGFSLNQNRFLRGLECV